MNSQGRRDVYLPAGDWVNLFDGSVTTGGQWLKDFKAPLAEMPVWVRLGATFPVYPEPVSCTDEMDLSKAITLTFDESYSGLMRSCLKSVLK